MEFEKRINRELWSALKLIPTGIDPLSPEGLPGFRTAPPMEADPDIKASERRIPGPDGAPDIRILIFEPLKKEGLLPGVLYLHGGGYAGGTTEGSVASIYPIVKEAGCIVVSPEYRLSPENPYPAGLEDCYATLEWMVSHAAELGIDLERIAVTGGSAGGGLTIAVCMLARDRKGPKIRFQMPLYPTMDDRLLTPSSKEITYDGMLNRGACENIWNMYLGEGHKDKDIPIYASPSRAEDYSGLPPCYTFVGDMDPHRDETLDYVTRLVQSGIPTGFAMYTGCFHGFEGIAPQAQVSRKANQAALEALITGLGAKL